MGLPGAGFPQQRTADPVLWAGSSGGIDVLWTARDLVAGPRGTAHPAVSIRRQWVVDAQKKPGCTGGNALQVQSVVGPVISYREESGGQCAGGSPPWTLVRLSAVDASREGTAASLSDWFPEGGLLRALLADKRVQEALQSGPPGPPPATLRALLERIAGYRSEDCRWGFGADLLTRFAVYRIEGERVSLRVGLSHGCEVARGSFALMNLTLPIPERWRDALTSASRRQEGFLMHDAPALFGRKRTAWDFPEDDGAAPVAAVAPARPVRSVSWGPSAFAELTPDGTLGLTTRGDGTVRLWDLAAGVEVRTFTREQGAFRSLGFSPDGMRAAAGASDGSATVWDLASGTELARLAGHRDDVWAVALSADGRTLLTGGGDRLLKLWDVAAGQELRTFSGHTGFVRAAAFVPARGWVVSASTDRTVRVWDAASGRQLRALAGHKGSVWALAIAPDGKSALSGADDRTIRLWDLETGAERLTLRGHEDQPRHVAFSPGGSLAVSADETLVRLWNVETGQDLGVVCRTETPIGAVRFAPDGRTVWVGSDDGVQAWPVPAAP
jgi:hypothetical protein